jgi:hypothetical protein
VGSPAHQKPDSPSFVSSHRRIRDRFALFGKFVIVPIYIILLSYALIDGNPIVCIVFAVFINSATNLYEKLKEPGGWEFALSCLVMVQFLKIVSATINVADGRRLTKCLKLKRSFSDKPSLASKPSFLEWSAYMVSPYGIISGPFFEFQLFEIGLDVGIRDHINPDSPSRRRATLRCFSGIFWALFNIAFMKYGAIKIYSMPFHLNSPLLVRSVLSICCTSVQSWRYWSAWDPVDAGLCELGLAENDIIENATISRT